MHVLPNLENSSGPQKVVVGDKSGILQSFGIKKQEVNVSFKYSENYFHFVMVLHTLTSLSFIKFADYLPPAKWIHL